MKKICLALMGMMMLFSIDCHADDYTKALKKFIGTSAEYKEACEEVMTTCSKLFEENLKKSTASPAEVQQKMSLMQRYINDEYIDDIIEIYEPYFKKHVTVEELKGLIKLRKDKKIERAIKKVEYLATRIVTDQYEFIMGSDFQSLLDGKDIGLPQKESFPDTSYQIKFQRYEANLSRDAKDLVYAMKPIIQARIKEKKATVSPEDLKKSEEILEKILTHMSQSFEITFTNDFIKTITEEELDALLTYEKAPGAKGVETANREVLGDSTKFYQEIAKKMQAWMTEEMQRMKNSN